MLDVSEEPFRFTFPGRPRLGRLLVEAGVITEPDLDRAIRLQVSEGCRLGEALLRLELCGERDLARAVAQQIDAPFVDLEQSPPLPNLPPLIPRELAMEFGAMPIRMEGSRLLLAALNPSDIRIDEAFRKATGLGVIVAAAPETQLRDCLRRYYGLASFEESHPLSRGNVEITDFAVPSVDALVAAGQEITGAQIVDTILADAVRKGASDLHVEPQETCVRVRQRIDGELCPIVTFPRSVLESVVARAKVMCNLDLAESRKPQDGGCRVRVDARNIELRLSTLPGVFGDMLVFRVLTRDSELQRLRALGFAERIERELRGLLLENAGMILVTGPTGCGKTTTLYGAIGHLNAETVKILTVEDPVEVKIPGVGQVQVDERAGRTFASTLRSMLRQDPDVLMVGEIRDLETAEIACRAALTGHLVLSSVHTRGSFGTLTRITDMGVEAYTLAAALNGVLAQRLVRRVCSDCAEAVELSPTARTFLEGEYGDLTSAQFLQGRGCPSCRNMGTRGRLGVHELLTFDDELRRMLSERRPLAELTEYAAGKGFRSMHEDAFEKACLGLVPPAELLKVLNWTGA